MNNVRQLTWPHLLGLCPLAAINLTIGDALLFATTLLITLLLTNACIALIQRWLIETQRLIITTLIATVIVGIIDLLLQAFCYERAQTLQLYLPLLTIAPLLLNKTDSIDRQKLFSTLRNALLTGGAFAVTLIIIAPLHATMPLEAGIALNLISCGLLCALANKFYPQPIDSTAPTNTPRTRARVTGPVR